MGMGYMPKTVGYSTDEAQLTNLWPIKTRNS
jgi:hypothetical protein